MRTPSRSLWLLPALLGLGCASAPGPASAPEPVSPTVGAEAPATPSVHVVEVEGDALRVDSAVLQRASLSLVGPAGACPGAATPGPEDASVSGCPTEPAPWVAFASEEPAKVTLAERVEAPSMEADAAYLGRFGPSGFGFRMESPAGDGLCPGAPTTITFLHGDPEAIGAGRVLGSTTVEAPITRSDQEGVMALVRVDGQLLAIVVYGGNRRRVVTLEGTTVLDAEGGPGEPCGCCDED